MRLCSSGSRRPRSTIRCNDRSTRPRPAWSSRSSISTAMTSSPPRARTSAMPAPIVPSPTTPAVAICTGGSLAHPQMIYAPGVGENDLSGGDPVTSTGIDVVALAQALEARSDEVALAMHELAHLLVAEESVDATLDRIAALAARTIDDCDAAGVTLYLDGRYVTAAHTDERTLAVDDGQYQRDQGPCLQAMRDQQVLRFDVEEAEDRWPEFVADARANNVRSFLAAPLMLQGDSIGALNLYSSKPSGFTALDDVLIALFTGQ